MRLCISWQCVWPPASSKVLIKVSRKSKPKALLVFRQRRTSFTAFFFLPASVSPLLFVADIIKSHPQGCQCLCCFLTVSHDELVAAFFSVASILHGALSRQSHWRQPRSHRTCDQRKVSSGKGSVSGSGRVVAGLAQLVAAPANGGVGPLLGHV